MRDLRTAGTRAVLSERLKTAGISLSAVAAMIAPVRVDEAKITARGEERGGALSTFLAAYVVAFLIYLMTTLYGVAVMRSVLEEKTNRIAEVLMSTIRAAHLVAGKIIGVGSAAVAQVLIWIVIMTVVVTQSHRLGPRSLFRTASSRRCRWSRSPACCCFCSSCWGSSSMPRSSPRWARR